MERRRGTLVMVLGLVLTACGIPRDPEGTLDRVTGGTMRVGVTENEPWTSLEGEPPAGVEADLVERFAATLDAEIEWVPGSAEELMTALEERQLDLAVGGFVEDDPWSTKIAFTHPFALTRLVVAVPPGVTPPESLEGVDVLVELGSPAGGLVEDTGGRPIPVDELSASRGPVATEHWRLDSLGLVESEIVLAEMKHVMAVPLGENAWLVRLERFLLDAPVEDLLAREVPA